MDNVVKYKGQLYKRVDSGAPKALKYKGQMFERVDSYNDIRWDREAWDYLKHKHGIDDQTLHHKNIALWKKMNDKIEAFINGPKGNLPEGRFEREFYAFCDKLAKENATLCI